MRCNAIRRRLVKGLWYVSCSVRAPTATVPATARVPGRPDRAATPDPRALSPDESPVPMGTSRDSSVPLKTLYRTDGYCMLSSLESNPVATRIANLRQRRPTGWTGGRLAGRGTVAWLGSF